MPDLAAARERACEGIRDFMRHEAVNGVLDFRGRIDIADDRERVLASVAFRDAFTIVGL